MARHAIVSGGSAVSDSLKIAQLVAGKSGATSTIEAGIRAMAKLLGDDVGKEVIMITSYNFCCSCQWKIFRTLHLIIEESAGDFILSECVLSLPMEMEKKAVSAQVVSCCVFDKIMQHMNGNIPLMFDCWANPVVHLFLLNSSMGIPYPPTTYRCYSQLSRL